MIPKIFLTLAFAGALTTMAAGLLAAQQPPAKGDMPMGDMGGMIKECHEQHQGMTKSMDQISKTLEDAQQSNDPAKMKSAIAQVQKQLADMKGRMSKCDGMMMQNMQGMQRGGMHGDTTK